MASIGVIGGIGPKNAAKLRRAGIRTTEALLKRGATRQGRASLAQSASCEEPAVLLWVNHADLMRVKGVGSEYADLLEAAGVDTVKELRRRNAASLTAKLMQVNDQKRLVRRLPTEAMVERWIAHAKLLQPVVSY